MTRANGEMVQDIDHFAELTGRKTQDILGVPERLVRRDLEWPAIVVWMQAGEHVFYMQGSIKKALQLASQDVKRSTASDFFY